MGVFYERPWLYTEGLPAQGLAEIPHSPSLLCHCFVCFLVSHPLAWLPQISRSLSVSVSAPFLSLCLYLCVSLFQFPFLCFSSLLPPLWFSPKRKDSMRKREAKSVRTSPSDPPVPVTSQLGPSLLSSPSARPSFPETPQKLPSWKCPLCDHPSLADLCFPGGLPFGQLGERSRLLEEALGL